LAASESTHEALEFSLGHCAATWKNLIGETTQRSFDFTMAEALGTRIEMTVEHVNVLHLNFGGEW
jgi:hypothetical protein